MQEHGTNNTSSRFKVGVEPEAAAALDLLRQCRELLGRVPAEIYSRPSTLLPGGTVGKHLRHLLDHFSALHGANISAGVVDYDHRERGEPTETNTLVGLGMIDRIERQLAELDRDTLAAGVRVRSMLAHDGAEAEHASTIGREVAFATHHGIHHAAMMGAICREHGMHVPAEFGKAPATLAFELAG